MNRKRYKDTQVERGEIFVEQLQPVQVVLGDSKVSHGFWRAIEHMRRGEKALIMVKPAWGYAMPDFADQVQFPTGWESGENREKLLKRRAFFEIKLHDWTIRHDVDGDGKIMKTVHERGFGMDRPGDFDEIRLALKIFQGERVFCDF